MNESDMGPITFHFISFFIYLLLLLLFTLLMTEGESFRILSKAYRDDSRIVYRPAGSQVKDIPQDAL